MTQRILRLTPLLLLSLVACSTPQQAERTPVPDTINDVFLSDELDVDAFVKRWELESREVYAGRKEIVAAMEIQPGDTVADVGTGTGLFLEPFATATGPDGLVYAVDISPRFIAHARERVVEEGLDQVEIILSNERSAELPENSVDVVFVCDTYHHFEYHEDMLRSIRRGLKPGGRLIFVEFDRIPGESSEWLLKHLRAGRDVFIAEIEAAGFTLQSEVDIPAFQDNYCLRFVRD